MSPSSGNAPGLPNMPGMPPPPPMFGFQPQGGKKKPQAQSQQTTFLGAGAQANPTNTGNKTLLGQ